MTMTNKDKALIHLGKILAAKDSFEYLKEKHTKLHSEAKNNYEEVKNRVNKFSINYEFYNLDSELLVAEQELKNSKDYTLVSSFEKKYKKLKHEFLENFKEFEFLLKDFNL